MTRQHDAQGILVRETGWCPEVVVGVGSRPHWVRARVGGWTWRWCVRSGVTGPVTLCEGRHEGQGRAGCVMLSVQASLGSAAAAVAAAAAARPSEEE